MSNVFLIGANPPQLTENTKIEAAHYRTWQFLQSLLDDGHTVCLCADDLGNGQPEIPPQWTGQLCYQAIPFGQRGWVSALQKTHDAFPADCIVAVNFSHCLYATKLWTDKPIWMDFYGDMLTIIQAACYQVQSDRGMATSISFLRKVLHTGDAFSVCGQPQKHALVGELAMAGRLSRRNFGYEFARVVGPGSPPLPQRPAMEKVGRPLLRRFGVGEEDFVVLWCGGYNTWTDVDTLFAGLEWAMAQDSRIRYVSVGANTYDAPDNVYARLLDMIAASSHSERFHMMGWRPWTEIFGYYRESDVGLNIDALHYETIYGTRTRLTEMIAAGLPVITSRGTELSYLLEDRGVALTFEVGDWQGLGQQIMTLA
jgi:glycosyltransferase involved in cell wall biosynthesis